MAWPWAPPGGAKKELQDPDNYDGVVTHLEPDILECEVKWALESITTNKASGHDVIPFKLFQILKDDVVKVLHSICQQIWTSSLLPWQEGGGLINAGGWARPSVVVCGC